MSALPPLPAAITATCRVYFGSRARRYRDNRCDSCPLRTPCLAHGSRRPNTIEQLLESRETFVAESLAVLG